MDPYLSDWLTILLRWLHVVAGIAWIGASFYFVRLDLSLRTPRDERDADAGVAGEFWGVHGGGLYHSRKFRLAPAEMPEPLHWFKWEAHTTWPSGLALRASRAGVDGEAACVTATIDHEPVPGAAGPDCGIYFVATLEAARGKRLASRDKRCAARLAHTFHRRLAKRRELLILDRSVATDTGDEGLHIQHHSYEPKR